MLCNKETYKLFEEHLNKLAKLKNYDLKQQLKKMIRKNDYMGIRFLYHVNRPSYQNNCICLATQLGNTELLNYFTSFGYYEPIAIIIGAAKKGDLEIIKKEIGKVKNPEKIKKIGYVCGKYNHDFIVEYIIEYFEKNHENYRKYIMKTSVTIKRLINELKEEVLEGAWEGNHQNIVDKYWKCHSSYGSHYFYNNAMALSAKGGHLEKVIEYSKNSNNGWTLSLDYAIDKGHQHVIDALLDKNVDWKSILVYSAGANRRDLVDLCITKGCDRFHCASSRALYKGHREMYEYIKQFNIDEKCAWFEAVTGGHLDLLEMRLKKWDKGTQDIYSFNAFVSNMLSYAVRASNKQMVDFLIENGAYEFNLAIKIAEDKGLDDLAEYLRGRN